MCDFYTEHTASAVATLKTLYPSSAGEKIGNGASLKKYIIEKLNKYTDSILLMIVLALYSDGNQENQQN